VRVASWAPRLANTLTQPPLLRWLVRRALGAPRALPPLAPCRFQHEVWGRRSPAAGGPEVVLFPDTFHNFFQPDAARAALEVLEEAGFHAWVPQGPVCCARPLLEGGRPGLARRVARRTLRRLAPQLERGAPVVVLDPECARALREALPALLPGDARAQRLAQQTHTLGEFLDQHALELELPRLERPALVPDGGEVPGGAGGSPWQVLGRLGLVARTLEGGCAARGGRRLLTEVRAVPDEALIVADSLCCREVVRRGSARRAMHLAQAARMALRLERHGLLPGPFPERLVPAPVAPAYGLSALGRALPVVLSVALSVWARRWARRVERARLHVRLLQAAAEGWRALGQGVAGWPRPWEVLRLPAGVVPGS
jgi:hypothetical protein